MKDSHVRDALAALSLSNLSLIGIWNSLLNISTPQAFFLEQAPSRGEYAAAMANVFLIGIIFFIVIRCARRFPTVVAAPLLLLITLPAANAFVRLAVTNFSWLSLRETIGLLSAAFCIAALIARRGIFSIAATLLIVLSPLIPMEAVLSIIRCWTDHSPEFANGAFAPRAHDRPSQPRILWIIFDELDYRLTFPDRPANLSLPQLDRLRAESIFAENAVAPTRYTLTSVPPLLTGVPFASMVPIDASRATADGLLLTHWPTIFSTVHRMGGNAAVSGWYLPYCRMFAQDLTACSWHGLENNLGEAGSTFPQNVAAQQQSLFEYGYISIFRQSLRAAHRIRMIQAMREESVRYAADPSLDLVFLHLPMPHPPHFYDRFKGTFTRRNSGSETYPDDMALTDLILGEIRASMATAGLWDKTTVLVSSDHPNRASAAVDGKTDARVPFLLKLAGQTAGVNYVPPLHTIVTKPLLEAIFGRQIASPEDAVKWLQTH